MGSSITKKYFSFSFFSVILFFTLSFRSAAQTDSLIALLNKPAYNTDRSISDTSRYYLFIDIGQSLILQHPDSALYYDEQARQVALVMKSDYLTAYALEQIGLTNFLIGNNSAAEKSFFRSLELLERCMSQNRDSLTLKKQKRLKAKIYYNIAQMKVRQSDHSGGLKYYTAALKLFEEVGHKKGMAGVLGNIGIIYDEEGNGSRALEYYFKALKINEEVGIRSGQAANLANIGIVYYEQNDYSSAIKYYEKALVINREVGNPVNEANNLGSIGNIFLNTGRAAAAYDYFIKAKKLYQEADYPEGVANICTNLALVYINKGDSAKKAGNKELFVENYRQAFDYHTTSLKYNTELENKNGIAMNYVNMGSIYFALGKYAESENRLKRSYKIAAGIHSMEELKFIHENFYELYKATGRTKEALDNFELFIKYRDSLVNDENSKAAIKMELKFTYQKQAAADSVAHAKESEVKSAEIRRQSAEIKAKKNQQYALFGGLLLVALFSVFMYNRFKITQKQKFVIEDQKAEVENQKHLVEEKQKEILDSIKYARRIQLAQIPSEKRVETILNKLK
jgi:tetratricopeptide (TPR) repeat protein